MLLSTCTISLNLFESVVVPSLRQSETHQSDTLANGGLEALGEASAGRLARICQLHERMEFFGGVAVVSTVGTPIMLDVRAMVHTSKIAV